MPLATNRSAAPGGILWQESAAKPGGQASGLLAKAYSQDPLDGARGEEGTMRQRSIIFFLLLVVIGFERFCPAQQLSAPDSQLATVTGTVLDINGGIIPGATVTLGGAIPNGPRSTSASDSGFFQFTDIQPGSEYRVTVQAPGFADWTSNPISLLPGQYYILKGIQLRVATVEVSVVAITPEQAAIEQVRVQETQRILGFIPNFYVNFDRKPQPMTSKLKFQLARKALTDKVTLAGFGLNAAFYQMAGWPGYRGGMAGYGQRLAATFAGGYGHVLAGDALLPAIFHQDPRYFYKGTGTRRSRFLYAISNSVFTVGDNGHRQVNYSGLGGDLVAGALANAYYPAKDKGVGLMLRGTLIGTAGRTAFALGEEFVLNRHPPER